MLILTSSPLPGSLLESLNYFDRIIVLKMLVRSFASFIDVDIFGYIVLYNTAKKECTRILYQEHNMENKMTG